MTNNRLEEELRRIKIERAAKMIDEMRLFNDFFAEYARKNGFEVRTVNLKDI